MEKVTSVPRSIYKSCPSSSAGLKDETTAPRSDLRLPSPTPSKLHGKEKLGTYKGLVVRNRTINAESDDDRQEDEESAEVVVEKAFVVTRVTMTDNVAQSRRATKGVLTKTSRPWKRV